MPLAVPVVELRPGKFLLVNTVHCVFARSAAGEWRARGSEKHGECFRNAVLYTVHLFISDSVMPRKHPDALALQVFNDYDGCFKIHRKFRSRRRSSPTLSHLKALCQWS